MAQGIKISVDANVSKAAGDIGKVDKSTDGLAKSLGNVGKAAKASAAELKKYQEIAERLTKVQGILAKEFRKPIRPEDAAMFLLNFDRMRSGRNMAANRLRSFGSFEEWASSGNAGYQSAKAAVAHRAFVFGSASRGAAYSQGYTPSRPRFGHATVGGATHQALPRSSVTPAMIPRGVFSVPGGMLGMIGLGGMAVLARSAITQAIGEAGNVDQLMRRTGAPGGNYAELRDAIRAAGGNSFTYGQTAELALQMAKNTGHRIGDLPEALSFARGYGIDPASSVDFFGSARRTGAMGNSEQEARRFANLIGEAVAKSGYSASGEKILQAIEGYSEAAARMTLDAAPGAAYAAMLAGMTSTGRPGLDVAGASGILNAADSAMRRGGAYGDASLNLAYAALSPGLGGKDPWAVEALYQGGLFGTSRNTFGPGTALAEYGRGVALDDTTNFEKIRAKLRSMSPPGSMQYLETLKNEFGLSSLAQAAALDKATPAYLNSAAGHKEFGSLTTPGSEAVKLTAEISNLVTALGSDLLGPMNSLKNAIVGLTHVFDPSVTPAGSATGTGGSAPAGGATGDGWLGSIKRGIGSLFESAQASPMPGFGSSPANEKSVIATLKGAGASDAEIKAILSAGYVEGGFKDAWRQSGVVKNGVREQSFGPWQLHEGGELNGYRAAGGKDGDLAAEALYTLRRLRQKAGGKITDDATAVRGMTAFEASGRGVDYYGAGMSVAAQSLASAATAASAPPQPSGSGGINATEKALRKKLAAHGWKPPSPEGVRGAGGMSAATAAAMNAASRAMGESHLPVMSSDYVFGSGRHGPATAGELIPESDQKSALGGGAEHTVRIVVDGETTLHARDQNGAVVGATKLRGFTQAPATGVSNPRYGEMFGGA